VHNAAIKLEPVLTAVQLRFHMRSVQAASGRAATQGYGHRPQANTEYLCAHRGKRGGGEHFRVGEIMRKRMGEVRATGWYGQRELSLVQVNYRVIQTERTEPGSSELTGDTNRENSA